MSIREIQSELKKLTPAELSQVEALVREIKATPTATTQAGTLAEYWKSLHGTVILKPGWDEDEPLETWEALSAKIPLIASSSPPPLRMA